MAVLFVVFLCGFLLTLDMAPRKRGKAIPVIAVNNGKRKAVSAPVSAGIPFARKAIKDPSILTLRSPGGKPVPLQTQCLSRWPDGCCRWVLLDFQATVAAKSRTTFQLVTSGTNPCPAGQVRVRIEPRAVTLSNGNISLSVRKGGAGATLSSADGKASAEIVSMAEVGANKKRVTSKVVIDSLNVYARGPLRAAVAILGRRVYSDKIVGPFSQRIEVFAGLPYVRVEDTLVYAHFPGSHARPLNPLSLWKVAVAPKGRNAKVDMISLVAPEESEGLVQSKNAIEFWGRKKPLEMARWTDEELIGEDTPGISLGVGKSCAVLVGIFPSGKERAAAGNISGVYAHTTPEVYAASAALGEFAPEKRGKYGDIEEGMRQILGFWLWHQDNDPKGAFGKGPWYGLFDWGDWQTRFADRKHQPTGWNYLQGRYGWDCNEMDTTLMLWSAFCHTARPEYWRAAVAMSRHMMDVDVINVDYRKYKLPEYVYDPHHYGAPWMEGRDRMIDMSTVGMGRRHNVQHWGNGVGDTRHTWNGGIIMYYYLTGNRRAYDTAIAMADMHMQRIWGYAAGEYCLSLWCLYNAWQLTGERKYLDEFKYRLDVVHKLRLPDGSLPEHLDFDKRKGYPDVDGNHGAYLDLTLDYVSNALIDYYADTKDRKAREVLLGLAERILLDTPPKGPSDYRYIDAVRILAWAYRETRDKRFLRRAKYHLGSLAAKPLRKKPANAEALLKLTDAVLRRFEWDIRTVGPLVRMAPYAMF